MKPKWRISSLTINGQYIFFWSLNAPTRNSFVGKSSLRPTLKLFPPSFLRRPSRGSLSFLFASLSFKAFNLAFCNVVLGNELGKRRGGEEESERKEKECVRKRGKRHFESALPKESSNMHSEILSREPFPGCSAGGILSAVICPDFAFFSFFSTRYSTRAESSPRVIKLDCACRLVAEWGYFMSGFDWYHGSEERKSRQSMLELFSRCDCRTKWDVAIAIIS